jgi:hypothetical protein
MGWGWVIGFVMLLPARANQAVIDQDSKHVRCMLWAMRRDLIVNPFARVKCFFFLNPYVCFGA